MTLRFPYLLLSSLVTAAAFLLDVGAPRTGTQSMFTALKLLGLNPLHTGYERESRIPLCGYLFGNHSLDGALATLKNFDGGMDEPTMLLYEEIMAAIPEAKFLLTISDPESWYDSYVRLMSSMRAVHAPGVELIAEDSFLFKCSAMRSWGCNFSFPSEGKEECLENYDKHNQRVQEVIPPERLLVYNWSDGWAPLSHFLGVPVPDKEFPHVDEVLKHFEDLEMEMEEAESVQSSDWNASVFAGSETSAAATKKNLAFGLCTSGDWPV